MVQLTAEVPYIQHLQFTFPFFVYMYAATFFIYCNFVLESQCKTKKKRKAEKTEGYKKECKANN